MRVRYFHLDESYRVHKAVQRVTEAAFLKGERWDGSIGTKSVWIVSFICDDQLQPIQVFVTPKLEIVDGYMTEESRFEAIAAVMDSLPQPVGPHLQRLRLPRGSSRNGRMSGG